MAKYISTQNSIFSIVHFFTFSINFEINSLLTIQIFQLKKKTKIMKYVPTQITVYFPILSKFLHNFLFNLFQF